MDKTLEEQGNIYLTRLYNIRVNYAVSMGGTTESKDYAGLGMNLDPLASQMAQLIIDQQARIKDLESQLTQVTEAEGQATIEAIEEYLACVDVIDTNLLTNIALEAAVKVRANNG